MQTTRSSVLGAAKSTSAARRQSNPANSATSAAAPLHDDALLPYNAKRNFGVTPEPQGQAEASGERLSYVIQKHWASSLHYDFRLELGGTLKSWAVPKGPSFDPKAKRMAVQVEDHPMAYAGFEGTVPPKQYGAGKVIVWDAGSWTPVGDPQQGYRDGNLKFELHGHKLMGRWVLVRIKGKSEKQVPWLLIKEKDAFARPSSAYSVVDELPDSVASLPTPTPTPTPTPSREPDADEPPSLPSLTPEAIAAALPDRLAPQLATLAAAPPPDAADWLCEIKFDGYRMLLRIDAEGPRLITRNGHDWTSRLRSLQHAIAGMKLPAGWYDGEIVVPNDEGIPDFAALQRSFEIESTGNVVLYLFDLPYFDGHDLRAVPLEARRAILKHVVAASASTSAHVRFSEAFDASPQSMVASACKLGLEGVIAKRRSSRYQSSRSTDWIKLKCGQRQEFVIGGYTEPQGARSGFGSLLLGVHDTEGALRYAGNVGSGFSQKALAEITKALEPLARSTSPFAPDTKLEGRPHWVAPTLVAEVSFGEWTRSGSVRHAVFRGLRTDKDAAAIVREKAVRLSGAKVASARAGAGASASATASASASAGATASASARTKGGSQALAERLHVTNPQRVIDPSTGITKIELVRYCALVGDLMMKHLKGRPVSLVRAPTGVDGQLFFQKHAETEKLPGIRQLDPALYISHPAMLEVASKQGVLSAAQWNVVEFHTLNTGTASFEHPDRMVFDLDPGDGVPWAHVQEAALLMRAFLAQLGLASFLKTSGGKGLHVVVPLRKVHDWDTVKGFSQAIVQHMAKTIPQRFVARSGPKNRLGRIFIDYLRNGLGATTVCAWSARARPGLGISVPVGWAELPSLRGGDHWTVKTVHERLDTGNQPWNEYARAARSLTAAMAALGYQPTPTLGAAPNKEPRCHA